MFGNRRYAAIWVLLGTLGASQAAAQPLPEIPPAEADAQETRMIYFSRNLSAQALVDFLGNRGDFDDVSATPNHDTESVVLSGPEDRVRVVATLLRRIDLAGQPQEEADPVPLGDPPRAPDPLAPLGPRTPRQALEPRQADPTEDQRFRTANFYAQNTSAQSLATRLRRQVADGAMPGVVVFVNQDRNGLVLTGPEPELGMAIDFLRRMDRPAADEPEGPRGEVPREPPRAEQPVGAQPSSPDRGRSQRQPQPVSSPAPVPARQQARVRLDVLLLALPSSETARQSDVLNELTGEVDLVMDRIDQLAADGEAKILNQYSLTALEGSPSMVQVGEQVPRVTGRTMRGDARGGFAPAVQTQLHQVGTMLNVTPQVGEDQEVTLEVRFQKSMVTPAQNGEADEDSELTSGGTITMTLEQNLRLEPGQAEALIASTAVGGQRPQPVRFVLVVAVRP